MKCNAVILASFALGQSVMATNIYRPGGHYQVRAFNGSEPTFPSGTGPSSGFARPTGKPSKPCKPKPSSAVESSVAPSSVAASSVAATSAAATSSEASVVTSAPAVSSDLATPSTALYTTTITNHLSETVVVTVTPQPATSIPEASASASTTAAVVPTTLKSADVDTPSTFVAPSSSSKTSANSLPPYPTTFSTGASSTIASTGFASGTGGAAYPTGSAIAAYYQCGGINYVGSTTCVEGTHCQVQNPYYSQCIYYQS
ncbi:hypothetical protein ACHAPC_001873 [Botrytis cinerea]